MELRWIRFLTRLRIIALAVSIGYMSMWTAGCSLYHLRKEVETINNSTILVGTVSEATPAANKPVVVLAYANNGSNPIIVHYTALHEPGPYELIVPKGEYFLFAFVDINGDLIYQNEEPSGQYSAHALPVESSGGVLINLNIVIKNPGATTADFPAGTAVTANRPKSLHSTAPGAIAALSDPLFDYENGARGYWQPLEFFREYGGNVYFLHPYDPAKIPILFVHGATGSPRGWEYLVSHLDLHRYQPWFYYYPSGASLKSMADLLFWKIYNLQARYQFREMDIVAHSMGGLVTRSFLVDYAQQFPSIKKFISISTRWSGDALSEMGVRYSPGVIPAWKDMGLQSEFVQSIYRRSLPGNIDFYLLFGHEGSRNPLRSNNDGVVTLESELDPRVQTEARMVYGFKEDHNSILTSKSVSTLINTILASAEQTTTAGITNPGGKLLVRYAHAPNRNTVAGEAQLYLLPVDQGPADGIFLSINRDGGVLGPLPPGDYSVSLLADGFEAKPARQTVTIRNGATAAATFALTPDGSVVEFLRRTFYKDRDPAGTYVLPLTDITIRSIRLTGKGVERILIPAEKKKLSWMDDVLDRRDWANNSIFAFYHLPEGDYSLTIEADGYERTTVRRRVVPGHPNVYNGIVMTPLQ